MAQKVLVTRLCDLDGNEAPEDGEPRRFSIDGKDYEIDLCTTCDSEFDATAGRWADFGRISDHQPGGDYRGNGTPRRRLPRTASSGPDNKTVRAWALQSGIHIADRGRIPADVIRRFEAANP